MVSLWDKPPSFGGPIVVSDKSQQADLMQRRGLRLALRADRGPSGTIGITSFQSLCSFRKPVSSNAFNISAFPNQMGSRVEALHTLQSPVASNDIKFNLIMKNIYKICIYTTAAFGHDRDMKYSLAVWKAKRRDGRLISRHAKPSFSALCESFKWEQFCQW